MTRPIRPKVSDPELRTALDNAGPSIENYHQNLDAVSADIRAVEKYLTDSGIRLQSVVEVRNSGHVIAQPENYDALNNYGGGIYEDSETIRWAPVSEDLKQWRLMFVVRRHHGELQLVEGVAVAGPTLNGQVETLEYKPLIETPVEVRLRAHRHLANLVKRVGESVAVAPLTTPSDDDSAS